MPNTITRGCPRCQSDLLYDVGAGRYVCAKICGYEQTGLRRDPRDLVVAPANGTVTVTVPDLAADIGLTKAGLIYRARSLGILTEYDERATFTVEEAKRLRSYEKKTAGRTPKDSSPKPVPPPVVAVVPADSPDTRTVQLTSGGSVSIAVSVPWLSLSKDDRAFVFDLVDRMSGYGQG